ncbi:MAG: anthranilate phosphoribosyltransferase [Clostridium sp.]|nr:anthranilate phosphoribosyltransferase [Clostridium sp.]
MNIKEAIAKLLNKENLTEAEIGDVMNQIMAGETTSAQKGGFLMGLKQKGETPEELLGAAKALRDHTLKIDIKDKEHLIDCCGTGGDGGSTFNISTTVAIVTAAGGVKIAKHGNRAVSSKSGSLDVLNALNIKTDYSKEEAERMIEEKGMAFLFAPTYNSGMKNVAKERGELGVRTIFNMLGPLLNPAPLTGQLLGVYDESLIDTVASVLLDLGLERAVVVHGNDGLDELTTTTTSVICEVKDGRLTKYELNPEDYGINIAKSEDIAGGTPEENAKITLDILNGVKGPKRDIVVLNAGAALLAGKVVDSIKDGVKMAQELIDSKKALAKYNELRQN